MWQDGRWLVFHRSEVFPDRCVKTNEPAHGRRLRQELESHRPYSIWRYRLVCLPAEYSMACCMA